ncbi:hypothetical protein LCGC14_1437910 [marine sediment metagenome]|uniref:Uncharacterized protein n=1 Tax=marine sediment metagenome TaxID=412755 RepID=A0A0F9M215_9ZZZZ
MKLTAGYEPFGEKESKEEAIASIKKTLIEIGKICGVSKEEFEEEWDAAINKKKNEV